MNTVVIVERRGKVYWLCILDSSKPRELGPFKNIGATADQLKKEEENIL